MEQIYYSIEGVQQGPVTRKELHQLLINNNINLETPIWNNALQQWVPLHSQPALIKGMELPASGTFTGTPLEKVDAGNIYMNDDLARAFKRLAYNDAAIEAFFANGGRV